LKVFIKPDGTVRDAEVVGGNPILAESAQKSVMQWKFLIRQLGNGTGSFSDF